MRTSGWSGPTRILASVIGGVLGFRGALRRDPFGLLLGLLGCGLMLRGITNQSARRIIGIGPRRKPIEVHKTLSIAAPIDVVFGFFADYGSFPQFMSNVVSVREIGGSLTHWVVKGPAGVDVEWDARLMRFIPNQAIGWRSTDGSAVPNEGEIRFDTNIDGTTRVDIKLSYEPPAGAVGHGIAKMFGSDPGSEMDQDLLNVKTLLEDTDRGRRSGRRGDAILEPDGTDTAAAAATADILPETFDPSPLEQEPERVAVWRKAVH